MGHRSAPSLSSPLTQQPGGVCCAGASEPLAVTNRSPVMTAGPAPTRSRPLYCFTMHPSIQRRASLLVLLLVLLLPGCKTTSTESAPEPETATSEPTTTTPGVAPENPAGQPPAPDEGPSVDGPGAGDDDSASTSPNEAGATPDESASDESGGDAAAPGGDDKSGPRPGGTATVELACSDKLDNDGDAAIDCDDTDCWSSSECEDAEGGQEEGPSGKASNQAPPEFAPGEGPLGPGPPGGPGPPPGGWTEPAGAGQGGPGGQPEGKGVACQDYTDCVCEMARRAKGEEIAGYNHSDTCRVTKTYTGNSMEEQCGHDLDNFKNALHDAEEIYKAMGIKIPAACQ